MATRTSRVWGVVFWDVSPKFQVRWARCQSLRGVFSMFFSRYIFWSCFKSKVYKCIPSNSNQLYIKCWFMSHVFLREGLLNHPNRSPRSIFSMVAKNFQVYITSSLWPNNQWLFLVPKKGGRWHIIHQLAVYTTFTPLIYGLLGGIVFATYHLLLKQILFWSHSLLTYF